MNVQAEIIDPNNHENVAPQLELRISQLNLFNYIIYKRQAGCLKILLTHYENVTARGIYDGESVLFNG